MAAESSISLLRGTVYCFDLAKYVEVRCASNPCHKGAPILVPPSLPLSRAQHLNWASRWAWQVIHPTAGGARCPWALRLTGCARLTGFARLASLSWLRSTGFARLALMDWLCSTGFARLALLDCLRSICFAGLVSFDWLRWTGFAGLDLLD